MDCFSNRVLGLMLVYVIPPTELPIITKISDY